MGARIKILKMKMKNLKNQKVMMKEMKIMMQKYKKIKIDLIMNWLSHSSKMRRDLLLS